LSAFALKFNPETPVPGKRSGDIYQRIARVQQVFGTFWVSHAQFVLRLTQLFADIPVYCIMKSMQRTLGSVLLIITSLSIAQAAAPRKDINPALLYLHAFTLFPDLNEEESRLLGEDNSGDVGDEERTLARKFDSSFQQIFRARDYSAACDWGTDVSDGPNALLPNFKKIRTGAYAGILRARIALADGDQARARDEIIALSVMSRQGAAGATLVGTMIQVASEMKILDFMAAHFEKIKPQTRSEIAAGLKSGPPRSTVADAMLSERAGFQLWIIGKIEGFRAQESDDVKVLEKFRTLMADTFNGETGLADKIIDASGGTTAGVIRYIKAVEPHYKNADAIARASSRDIKRATTVFEAEMNSTTNLLARVVMPNIGKARMKELDFEARLARMPNEAP
jgi:hypothetical protein